MSDRDREDNQSWKLYILPSLLAAILAAVLGAVGWGITEYWSNYKEHIRVVIKLEELSEKLTQTAEKLKISQKKLLELKEKQQSSNEISVAMIEELEAFRDSETIYLNIENENKALINASNKHKNEISILNSKNVFLSNELKTYIAKTADLQHSIDKHNFTLQLCNNRPSIVDSNNIMEVFYTKYEVGPRKTLIFADGEGWIEIESIGRDENGIFAIARSSIFDDAINLYCIRPKDVFLTNSYTYILVLSIGETVVINDNVRVRQN